VHLIAALKPTSGSSQLTSKTSVSALFCVKTTDDADKLASILASGLICTNSFFWQLPNIRNKPKNKIEYL